MIQNFLDKSIYIYKMASQFHLKFILQKPLITVYCTVAENIHTAPTQGIGIYWGVGGGGGGGGSVRPKNLKTCLKLILNFQRGGGILEIIPSVGEVWIFSGITHCLLLMRTICCICLEL